MLRPNFEIHKNKRPCAFKAQGRLLYPKKINIRSAARLAAGNKRKADNLIISSYFYLTTN
jgi:hypothetical protein